MASEYRLKKAGVAISQLGRWPQGFRVGAPDWTQAEKAPAFETWKPCFSRMRAAIPERFPERQ
jgi:hypothetical protein